MSVGLAQNMRDEQKEDAGIVIFIHDDAMTYR